ncbi:hypothetical protein IscW_ISCW004917 [Ixodes scapularis]|uniref:DDE-1 domain-containing protein n=1 Tax=Ixodes scapularis TaxID=6945 RepID=B7PFY3_IXOSC|nr:hypothetical protein IscW_ISCW004917 [Ixodes scapularis]|eukprot:XP_002434105.1 hypothetical protein IscW_ISCW004917 [Ixodes scapularis]
MTRTLFREWLTDFDKEMVEKRCEVLPFLVNCTAHHINAYLSNVEVLFLPLNTTARLYPLDRGIKVNFKVH